ncbi:MAG: dTMP kinase [Candidatus Bathyarchaeota archaeon]|nr:dTMP kinase [Candidatus Bathyarchaeota archaeon]
MSQGGLIVFEGIDGSGKTEQIKRLEKRLIDENFKVTSTREPTNFLVIGKLIRNVLNKKENVSDEALALLFAADRADHTKKKIIPSIKDGFVVLSDRYVFSSLAYQGKGMKTQLDINWLKIINKYAISPNIVIFLDIPPEIGLERLKKGQTRIHDDNYFENLTKQENIRSVYYKIFNLERTVRDLTEYQNIKKIKQEKSIKEVKINNMLILRVDGTKDIEVIEKEIYNIVKKYLIDNKIGKNNGVSPTPLHYFTNGINDSKKEENK